METKAITPAAKTWPALFGDNWIDKFFDQPLDAFFGSSKTMNVPAINVTEDRTGFYLTVATPGLEKKDIKVEVADNILTISAEKEKEEKEEKNGRYNRREYNYSSWSRSFTLPENCDAEKIGAEYKNGELKLVLPKTEIRENNAAKTIAIN